jgi:hypothetical protein
MQITRNTLETAVGPEDWFTGSVYIDTLAAAAEPSRLAAANVHFTPGARTAWHTHRSGRRSGLPRVSACASAAEARSRRFGQATASTSNPVRTTGTAQPPTASWSTSRCRKWMSQAARLAGAST